MGGADVAVVAASAVVREDGAVLGDDVKEMNPRQLHSAAQVLVGWVGTGTMYMYTCTHLTW